MVWIIVQIMVWIIVQIMKDYGADYSMDYDGL